LSFEEELIAWRAATFVQHNLICLQEFNTKGKHKRQLFFNNF